MKVLFLDIDGVISRFRTNKDGYTDAMLDEPCIHWLKRIVEVSDCRIVISSTWKASPVLMDILEEELFSKLPNGCVIGCTPTLIPQVVREKEIAMWLMSNQDIESFCIIDDYDFELKWFLNKGCCVITDAILGICRMDANKTIQILNSHNANKILSEIKAEPSLLSVNQKQGKQNE